MTLFPADPLFVVGDAGFDTVVDGQKLDLLGRKPLGQKLTDLVDRIDQPLVIALDGGWGSGKSHFLKLWTGAHSKELGGQAEVIYFDAFEHDFLDDPLVSLVSRLTSDGAEKTWGTKAIDRMKKAAFPLAKLAARVGLAAATAGASEIANAMGDAALGKAADAADATIDQFWKTEANRIAAMQGFRQALTDLTAPKAEGASPRKIVFIVDELDRCRPDYALSMLEIIKHFFAVPNVYFVLGVNLEALENSVRTRYGSKIDAEKYLQKFIMLTMPLPHAKMTNPQENAALIYFTEKAPRYVASANFFRQCEERFERPIRMGAATLRDVQRLLSLMVLWPRRLDSYAEGYRTILIGALYLKALHPFYYKKLKAQTLTVDDVVSCLFLEQPKSDNDYQVQHQDWVCWAYALNGEQFLRSAGVPAHLLDGLPLRFGIHGSGFRWHRAQLLISDALESFEIPTP